MSDPKEDVGCLAIIIAIAVLVGMFFFADLMLRLCRVEAALGVHYPSQWNRINCPK